MFNTRLRWIPALACLGLVALPSAADIADVVDSEGNRMRFEYQDKLLRINPTGQDGYMIVRDNRTYVIQESDGEIMVLDLSQAMSMFGGMLKSATPETVDVKVESLEATGNHETVAGIQGAVYRLRYIDENGQSRETDMVLSDDPRALGFRDAVFLMAQSIADSVEMDLEGTDKLQQQLANRDLGVLRYGQDMRITRLENTRVDDARFVLPAEPTDLSGLGKLFGGSQQGKEENGGLGGLFNDGSSSDEHAEDPQGSNAVENATKEIGKAFGKLFGK